jgi:peptidoglycan/LPS O-acetylase OafA/YrhL
MVISSHFYINGGAQYNGFQSLGFSDIGNIGLYIFFSISGYLVTKSWLRDPNPLRFLTRRALRIFPALITVVFFCVFVIGPLFTTLGLISYLKSSETWAYFWNILLSVEHSTLPGVFSSNVGGIVNGPLWTLRFEFLLYCFVMVFGIFGGFSNKTFSQIAFLVSVIIGLLLNSRLMIPLANNDFYQSLQARWCVNIAFLTGVCFAAEGFQRKIFLGILFFLSILDLVHSPNQIANFSPIVIGLLAIRFGQEIKIDIGKNDYSYGLYLWGWVFGQVIFSSYPHLQNIVFVLIAICASFGAAYLSWHLVEKHALSLKPETYNAPATFN